MMNVSHASTWRLTGAVALATAALTVYPAWADGGAGRATVDNEVDSRVVNYADLNLETDAGARTLYKRLNGAARQVCHEDEVDSSRELYRYSQFRWCYNGAMQRAVHDVNSPRLLALLQHRKFMTQPWKDDSALSGG